MGFFKNISLDVHAQALAATFAKIREDQFSCILSNVERVLGISVATEKLVLSGEADLSLKGFQFWILLRFMSAQGYLSSQEADMFNGMVMKHGWNANRDAVRDCCLNLEKYHQDSADQLLHVAMPIADYLLGDHIDPTVWVVMGRTLFVFSTQTQLAIAREFRDKQTIEGLQSLLEGQLCYMSGEAPE